MNIYDPFVSEIIREKLAIGGNLKGFKKTYRDNRYKSIKNINSEKFWNKKVLLKIGSASNNKITSAKNKKISRFIKYQKGKFLDVGFGYGDLEKQLGINKDLEIYGIDISKHAVLDARKKLNGIYKLGAITKIPFKNNFFDVITTLDVIEHVQPVKTFKSYREIYRVLKDGGLYIVSVPLNEPLRSMVENGENPNGHVRLYTPNILKAEILLSGFEILDEHYLYAFRTFFHIKSFLMRFLGSNFRKPNLIIIIARKI